MLRLILFVSLACAVHAHAQTDSIQSKKYAIRLGGEAGALKGAHLNAGFELEYQGFFAGVKYTTRTESILPFIDSREINYNSFGLGYNMRVTPNFGLIASAYFGKGEVIDASLEHEFFFFYRTVVEKYPTTTTELSYSAYFKYHILMLKAGATYHANNYFNNLTINLGVLLDIDF